MERLLTLFNQFSQLVKEAFDDDPRFLTARDKAYKHVVNDTSVFRLDLPTRLVLPSYTDSLLAFVWLIVLHGGCTLIARTRLQWRCQDST